MIVSSLFLLILAILGTPLFIVFGASALLSYQRAGLDLALVMGEVYRMAQTPILVCIPLFSLAGNLMAESGTPRRLVRLSRAMFGWLPGGLAIVALVACAIFTALTGASGVTIIALGGFLMPVLIAEGYPENFRLGLLATAGSRGLLFVPSLPLILYAIVAKVQVNDMFRAGIVPGLFPIFVYAVYSGFIGHRSHVARSAFSFKELGAALWESRWELPLPIFVLGGIYAGKLAISEAAAASVFYLLIAECFLYRDLNLRQVFKVIKESMALVGSILIILGMALAYTNFLIDAEVPMKLMAAIQAYITSRFTFLILLNVFLLIVGCMLDIFSALVVVIPLILPIAAHYHVHPVHLGMIFLTNLEIGYSTPPVGINLFIASQRFNTPLVKIYRASIPFMIILLIVLAIITYWPEMSLFLVK